MNAKESSLGFVAVCLSCLISLFAGLGGEKARERHAEQMRVSCAAIAPDHRPSICKEYQP